MLGREDGQVLAFLGIPYAAPPIGRLRYASPRPHPGWTEALDATKPGAAPIQTLVGAAAWLYDAPAAQSEDCLFLNVWTPSTTGKRPVMVWLHGGAWRTGHGAVAGTNGARLAQQGDVVVVTVNYRLGALGWLAHPDLADPATGAAANWGLQDQIAALRWVQANIAALGGDPANVTLFGQSAGGSSTASIAQDPRNAGLLHRAIIESGSLHGAPGFPEMATAAAYTEALAKRLDVTVPGLRNVPALALHQAELTLARDPAMVRSLGRPPVLPVLDGVVLKVWPRDGALPPIPLMIGTTLTEGTFWYDLVGSDGKPIPGLKPPETMEQLQSMIVDLAAIYRPEAADKAAGIVPAYLESARRRGTPETPLALWVDAYTDIVFRLRAREAALRHSQAGNLAFLYEFAHPLAAPAHGVPHTSEIPFVFGTYADPFFAAKVGAGAAEQALSDRLISQWSRFAHGDMTGLHVFSVEQPNTMILGGPADLAEIVRETRFVELQAWGVV
jgi:para-nitrobenzyl esterase